MVGQRGTAHFARQPVADWPQVVGAVVGAQLAELPGEVAGGCGMVAKTEIDAGIRGDQDELACAGVIAQRHGKNRQERGEREQQKAAPGAGTPDTTGAPDTTGTTGSSDGPSGPCSSGGSGNPGGPGAARPGHPNRRHRREDQRVGPHQRRHANGESGPG